MVNGRFGGQKGRRGRGVEGALSASAFLPTFAFAALGTVTVLLVSLIGMSHMGTVVGPSTRDGGLSVTTPRVSISIIPGPGRPSAPRNVRKPTNVVATPTFITAPVDTEQTTHVVAVPAVAVPAVAVPAVAVPAVAVPAVAPPTVITAAVDPSGQEYLAATVAPAALRTPPTACVAKHVEATESADAGETAAHSRTAQHARAAQHAQHARAAQRAHGRI